MTGPRRARLAASACVVALLMLASAPQSASAYWSVTSASASSGASVAARVNQATTPTATVATQNDITVSWAASTLSNGAAVTGYTVARYDTANGAASVLSSCSGIRTTLSCLESNVPDGLWTYAITARVGTNWAGPQGTKSVTVRSDATAPVNSLTRNAVSGGSVLTGSRVYYRGIAAGSFTLSNAMTDAGSGVASSSTAALGATPTGWTHTPSTVSTPAGGPFVSNSFTWIAGTTSAPTEVVTGRDAYGNAKATTLTFTNDSTGPTGGAITYTGGTNSTGSVTITLGTIADAGSGTGGGYRYLQQSTAILTGTTCGSFTPFADQVTNPTASQKVTLTAGTCYQFRYRFSDSVGNETITTNPNMVMAK